MVRRKESPGRLSLQERVMEGGRSETEMVVVTDTEKTEPLLTVVLMRSPASGLKQKVSQWFLLLQSPLVSV